MSDLTLVLILALIFLAAGVAAGVLLWLSQRRRQQALTQRAFDRAVWRTTKEK
jgi:flagellar basal body-associated protein FliL